jgi:putative hydrolase of the HAD superfamily
LGAAEPRAILFDLDETIIDFGGNIDEAWREACEDAADRVRTLDAGVLYDEISATRDWFWADEDRHRKWRQDMRAASAEIARLALAGLGHEADPQLARQIADHYRDLRDASYALYPGAVETLIRKRAEGCQLAMVTNGSSAAQREKIERFDLARHFEHIQIEGEHDYGKPDPRAYADTLQALGVAPAEAWFVGDHLEWDVIAPKRLGMFAVWVNPDGDQLPSDLQVAPDLVIRCIRELP